MVRENKEGAMMNVSELISALDAEFFAGGPDSKLRPLVD